MANEGNMIAGLVPVPNNKGLVNTRDFVPISTSNSVALFIGGTYKMSSGLLVGAGAGNAEGLSGCIVALYNTSGAAVLNLPISTGGFAEVTYEEGQEYEITVDSTAFAASGADNGKMYNFIAETGTANANGYDGDARSKIQLSGTSENADTRQFVASKIVRIAGNVGGVANTVVSGKINSVNWLQW